MADVSRSAVATGAASALGGGPNTTATNGTSANATPGTDGTPAAAVGSAGSGPVTLNEYKKQQALVRALISRRQEIEKELAHLEDTIAAKEQAYLEATPNGNIITGYDHYMKSSGGGGANRRKMGLGEQNKVFTRSSISYRPNASDTATTPGSTPAASHAPTPLSMTFKDGPASSHATPTSATTASAKAGNKKRKLDEESEDDGGPAAAAGGNKKRTHFGAGRK